MDWGGSELFAGPDEEFRIFAVTTPEELEHAIISMRRDGWRLHSWKQYQCWLTLRWLRSTKGWKYRFRRWCERL